jgi:hypothetical protein
MGSGGLLGQVHTSFVVLIYQFEGRSKPHISGWIGVFVSLHSQLLGMYVIKLNSWYKLDGMVSYKWEIETSCALGWSKHGGWNICGQVLKAHPPLGLDGFRHMQHIMPSYVKCCGIGHRVDNQLRFEGWTIGCCIANPNLLLGPDLCLGCHQDAMGTH